MDTTPDYYAARTRVAEYLRQRARQGPNYTGAAIHSLQTDPEAEMADLLAADLMALLKGAPINREPDRTAHWGTCENNHSMIIYPHPDAAEDLPEEEDWEDHPAFIDCPVCDARMDWGGTDHPADLLRNY